MDVAHVLLGAGLVAIGVLASALADRIRGLRIARETGHQRASRPPVDESVERFRSTTTATKRTRGSRTESKVRANTETATDGADDVIAALVATGYKKQLATEATHACGPAERATVEEWARAALRGCVSRGVS